MYGSEKEFLEMSVPGEDLLEMSILGKELLGIHKKVAWGEAKLS